MANELSVVLSEQFALPSVYEALPKDFNKARFIQNAMALINEHPELRKYEQGKLVQGLMKGAYMGLDFFNGEAHLIPYGSELKFEPDYSGLQKTVKKYSIRKVKEIYARIVREGDEFSEEVVHNDDYVTFKPLPFNTGAIRGAFAVCVYEDGGAKVEVMSIQELETVKRLSKAQTGTAWKFFPEQMYKKTVIRLLCKGIPVEFENAQQQAIYNDEESIDVSGRVIEEEGNPFD